ncbi:MAG: 23S rRNA (guanosine(2251)-2'-O)-methyltransferase RlmB [Bacteroidales bacterium]|jgi:23S rRNA (guanosine2251-2'-O)-methyltransferase|nr:23S rRNA (guanosine(2251)-2'-O)-methyltransferase RlmB [Bacteroidales bacterium]
MDNSILIGTHAVHEALKDAQNIDQILIKKQSDNELIREIIYLARKLNITVKSVPLEKLNSISRKNHQGIIAFSSPIEFSDLHNIIPELYESGKNPFILILDQVSDVRNFGAIIRSCECFGVDAVVVPQKGAAQINENAVKTSAGSIFKIPICKVKSLTSSIEFLKNSGLSIISITEKSSQKIYDSGLSNPIAVVMGSEETGISKNIIEMSDACVQIPMYGTISSLNVSVAAGITLYEISKQRHP